MRGLASAASIAAISAALVSAAAGAASGIPGYSPAAAEQPGARGNGCGSGATAGIVPDTFGKANFRPACDRHDACYGPSSTTSRRSCDIRLRADMHAECQATYGPPEPDPPGPRGPSGPAGICHSRADTYFDGVRTFGKGAYQGRGDRS